MINDSIKRTILYYPTITIPTSDWLRQALLYWDEIGSIVPQNWENKSLITLGPDIEYLQNEGEFRAFDPQMLLLENGINKLEELEKEFKEIIESEAFGILLLKDNIKLSSHVHRDKVSYDLFTNFLEPKGLAVLDENKSDWYLLEKNTALIYMSILAKYLSEIDIEATVTGTDREEYQNLIYSAQSTSGENYMCIGANFRNFLPVPREDTALSDIIAFKRKRRLELLNFRGILSEYQNKLSKADQPSDIREVSIGFKETVEKGISDLTCLLKDSKIASIAGSLKTVLNIKSPSLLGGIMAAAGIITIPIGWTIAGLSIMGAIEIGHYNINKRNQKKLTLRNSPFSYLYYLKDEDIVK